MGKHGQLRRHHMLLLQSANILINFQNKQFFIIHQCKISSTYLKIIIMRLFEQGKLFKFFVAHIHEAYPVTLSFWHISDVLHCNLQCNDLTLTWNFMRNTWQRMWKRFYVYILLLFIINILLYFQVFLSYVKNTQSLLIMKFLIAQIFY